MKSLKSLIDRIIDFLLFRDERQFRVISKTSIEEFQKTEDPEVRRLITEIVEGYLTAKKEAKSKPKEFEIIIPPIKVRKSNPRFDPLNLISLSQLLLDNIEDLPEAKIRTIFNRCYYGVFLYLSQRLDINPRTYGAHGRVFNELKGKSRKLAKDLNYLYAHRLVADYSLEKPAKITGWIKGLEFTINFNEKEAELCVYRALRLIREFNLT